MLKNKPKTRAGIVANLKKAIAEEYDYEYRVTHPKQELIVTAKIRKFNWFTKLFQRPINTEDKY